MSAEYLPPPQEYPNRYHVRRNRCGCHPETCSCGDWAVYSASGEKLRGSFFYKDDAEIHAAHLNSPENL